MPDFTADFTDFTGGDAHEEVLVAVAHGSSDPRAAATIAELMELARARLPHNVDLRTAYLGHAAPALPQVLGAIRPGQRVTVLPLLLTAAYHSKTDIPRILARSRRADVAYGATLGPHPLLLSALDRRLDIDPADRRDTSVVLAAAGSSDPAANATLTRLAAGWQASGGWRAVRPGYASAASPTPAEAVSALLNAGARRVVVASYLLAPGLFADRVREESLAAGAAAVSPALGAAPEVAEVLLARYIQVSRARQAAA
jgi:sirohydrochlorin ferrochelatase